MPPAPNESPAAAAGMPPSQRVAFGPFVLDLAAARLLRGRSEVALRPKAYALLRVLAARAGELVTKDELLDSVWGTRFVTEGVIKTTVAELREGLGDDPKAPRWIETVPRRGYRFVATADAGAVPAALPAGVAAASASVALNPLVGRDAALAGLTQAWQQVCAGERRIVFVTGDAGIGKSALAAALVDRVGGGLVAHGQCVESFGRGEPYLPWLEALSSLSASVHELPALLRRCAPSWLAQMPWLHSEADRAALAAAAPPAADRMPREMAALLEQLGRQQPILILLEDLHWSDHASAQLIDFLARRRGPPGVMLLATFRATDLLLGEHPMADIRRELRLHGLAAELALDGLDAPALAELLARWVPGAVWSASALASLLEHTEGVPLFARAVLDVLIADGVLLEPSPGCWRLSGTLPPRLPVPDSLAGLFEKQLATLAAAQRELLEAAAVAGVEFDARVLARALDREPAELHARCDGLVRGGRWLRAAGVEAPPGAPPSGRYRFGHSLMHSQCLARCGSARRVALHRRIAAALVERHGGGRDELVAQLAYHHEQALDAAAALPLLRQAIRLSSQRQAPRETLALADRALALLAQGGDLPAAQRRDWTYEFASSRASAIGLIDGYACPALGEAAGQALAAAEGRPLDEGLLNLHRILWLHHVLGARFDHALALAEQAVARAGPAGDSGQRVQALSMLHFSAFKCGAFGRAYDAIAQAEALAPTVVPAHAGYARFFAQQAHERALISALMATLQGRPAEAGAAALRHFSPAHYVPMGRVLNGVLCGLWLAWQGDARAVAEDAAEVLALIEREELTSGAPPHRVLLHWAQGVLGDAAEALPLLRAALVEALAGAHAADRAALLDRAADLALRAGLTEAAAADVDAAFAHVALTGERYLLPLLWQRRAEIAAARGEHEAAAQARARAARLRREPASA